MTWTRLDAGWSMAALGNNWTLDWTEVDDGSTSNLSLGITSGNLDGIDLFCHTDILTEVGYARFGLELGEAMTDRSTTSGEGWTYSFAMANSATPAYEMTVSGYAVSGTRTIALDFNGDEEFEGVMGRTGNLATTDVTAYASGASISTITPWYSVAPNMGCKSRDSGDYEPNELFLGGHAQDGNVASVTPATPVYFNDFSYEYETREATFKHLATSSVPWTWHHFFEAVRGHRPFAVIEDGTTVGVHTLRPEGTPFRPKRAQDGFEEYWNIELQTYVHR